MAQTPGERIAETVYYLDDGETYASVEGKRAALAKKIDRAIEREFKIRCRRIAKHLVGKQTAKGCAKHE